MTPAPVGFQCPECVTAGKAAVRAPTGEALPADAKPVVTYALMAVCVGVYLLQFVLGDQIATEFAMRPVAIAFGADYYRLFTAMFLHASILHIAFNMYVLFVLGPTLERILGHWRFLLLYLLAGLGGSAVSYAFSTPTTWSVGASGAIFGLMGALLVAGKRLRYDVNMVLALVAINVVIGFVFSSGIDWRAHLGGLATGAAIAAIMVTTKGISRPAWVEISGVLVILGAVIGLVVLRTNQLLALAG